MVFILLFAKSGLISDTVRCVSTLFNHPAGDTGFGFREGFDSAVGFDNRVCCLFDRNRGFDGLLGIELAFERGMVSGLCDIYIERCGYCFYDKRPVLFRHGCRSGNEICASHVMGRIRLWCPFLYITTPLFLLLSALGDGNGGGRRDRAGAFDGCGRSENDLEWRNIIRLCFFSHDFVVFSDSSNGFFFSSNAVIGRASEAAG